MMFFIDDDDEDDDDEEEEVNGRLKLSNTLFMTPAFPSSEQ